MKSDVPAPTTWWQKIIFRFTHGKIIPQPKSGGADEATLRLMEGHEDDPDIVRKSHLARVGH